MTPERTDKRRLRFVLSVEKNHRAEIEELVERLKGLGVRVEQIMPSIGIITGATASGQALSALKIKGVKNVEPDRDVKAR